MDNNKANESGNSDEAREFVWLVYHADQQQPPTEERKKK